MSNTEKTKINTNYYDFNLINGNLRFNQKIFSILTAGVIFFSGVSLLNKVNSKKRVPTVDVETTSLVNIIKNISSLDDVLANTDACADSNIDWLDDLVKLSNRLHQLDLKKRSAGLDKYANPYEFDINVIAAFADEFEELLANPNITKGILNPEYMRYNVLVSILESSERAVNISLNNSVYDILANYGEALIKSKVLDAYELDYKDVDNIRIGKKDEKTGNYSIYFVNKKTLKEKTVLVENSNISPMNYLYNTLENINKWREKARLDEEPQEEYISSKNKEINESINMLKLLTLVECQIKNGDRIAVTTKMKTLETLIEMAEETEYDGSSKIQKMKN